MRADPAPEIREYGRRLAFRCHSGARAKRANPESITTNNVITDRRGLWIPALASLGRNDKKAKRWLTPSFRGAPEARTRNP